MRDDPITMLERELVDAARRLSVVPDERTGSHEPRGPRLSAPRPARRRSSFGAIAAVAASGLAVLVALGAVVALHGRPDRMSRPPAPASSRQQLIDILGVLRRPQTPADLNAPVVSRLIHRGLGLLLVGTPDVPLIRYATTTPWGEKLYLVPMKPPTAAQLAAFARRAHLASDRAALSPRGRQESLGVFSSQGGGGAGVAATIKAGESIGTEGGGAPWTRVTVVVPDGVATVKFVFPRQPQPGRYWGPIYGRSLTVSVPVHGNVAAVQIDRQAGLPVPMIWYGPDGHVIKRIGDLGAVNRVVLTPQPGP